MQTTILELQMGLGVQPNFLSHFKSKQQGILIATAALVGEGFDDPAIDSVFVTYASESIGHLMQVAGRALRRQEGSQKPKLFRSRPLNWNITSPKNGFIKTSLTGCGPEFMTLCFQTKKTFSKKSKFF